MKSMSNAQYSAIKRILATFAEIKNNHPHLWQELVELSKESNLISDIEELKKDRARLEDFNVYSGRLYLSIRTKDCNIMTLDIDKNFVDFLSQQIVRIIDKKDAELNELKKHIIL